MEKISSGRLYSVSVASTDFEKNGARRLKEASKRLETWKEGGKWNAPNFSPNLENFGGGGWDPLEWRVGWKCWDFVFVVNLFCRGETTLEKISKAYINGKKMLCIEEKLILNSKLWDQLGNKLYVCMIIIYLGQISQENYMFTLSYNWSYCFCFAKSTLYWEKKNN